MIRFSRSKTILPLFIFTLILGARATKPQAHDGSNSPTAIFGFQNPTQELAWEKQFLAVPDPKLAEEHLRILTQAPHMAGTIEDKATADYVAKQFRAAGLETEISEYRVWINYPSEISVDITSPAGVHMHGPTREHVDGDPYQDDARIVMPFNALSPSGDVEADVVYANYGTPDDFKNLEALKIDVRGKIVLVRYGQNFRGVKALVAQEHGAAAVIIYSDPADDGWAQGDKYPKGPWRPDTGVQRGSVGYIFEFAGDPTTPGIASTPDLAENKRTPPGQSSALTKIPVTPISYADAWPILEHLSGQEIPHGWQGALPFAYHVGPGPVRVKMHLKQDYQYRTIWDVTGQIRGLDSSGSDSKDGLVIAGNHRDAWVYGAVDPNSGTAAMLETVHGIGELLKSGWHPKRTIVFASWDAEEFGLMGSTEWAEQHETELAHAAAYFNMDAAVSGPKFEAHAVPSLKQFVRDIAMAVPSPAGGSMFEAWQKTSQPSDKNAHADAKVVPPVGDLGSGSDYTVFLQHLGVPSSDINSSGKYGVYHSAFDNFNWFKKFGDPTFAYEQELARFFGMEVLRMADADMLPFDYDAYGKEVTLYIEAASKKAQSEFGPSTPDFRAAADAARRFEEAGVKMMTREQKYKDEAELNQALRSAERSLLSPEGLPHRAWYRHAVYAPGEYTGYTAVVIPGVNESIDRHDLEQTQRAIAALAAALTRAADTLNNAH